MKLKIEDKFEEKRRIIGRHLFDAARSGKFEPHDMFHLAINAIHLLENPYDPIFDGNSDFTAVEDKIARELQALDEGKKQEGKL